MIAPSIRAHEFKTERLIYCENRMPMALTAARFSAMNNRAEV